MAVMPCIGVARTAGLQLKAMCEKGPVRVWFRTHVKNGWHPVQITVAEMEAALAKSGQTIAAPGAIASSMEAAAGKGV